MSCQASRIPSPGRGSGQVRDSTGAGKGRWRSLTEAGFSLHECRDSDPRHVLGGVCLHPLSARIGECQAGVTVSWTTHDRLLRDGDRWATYSVLIRAMNQTLGTVLRALGYDTEPFGTGGAWIVTADQSHGGEVTPR